MHNKFVWMLCHRIEKWRR